MDQDTIIQTLSSIETELGQPIINTWELEKQELTKEIQYLQAKNTSLIKVHQEKITLLEEKYKSQLQEQQQQYDEQITNLQQQIIELSNKLALQSLTQPQTQTQIMSEHDNIQIINEQYQLITQLQDELKDQIRKCSAANKHIQDKDEFYQSKVNNLQELVKSKQKELKEVKQLAQVIVNQRTEIEDYFIECFQRVQQGDDMGIRNMNQQTKIRLLKEIIDKLQTKHINK